MTIRLQFSTSTEFSSAVIRRVTHSAFSHVDAVLADGNLLGASNSPKAPHISGNPNGVAIRPPDYQVFGARKIAELECTPEQERAFYDLMLTQLNKPFDDHALITFLSTNVSAPRDWRDPAAWFCSEYGLWGLERSGFWSKPIPAMRNRVAPADLLNLLNQRIINATDFAEDPLVAEINNAPVKGNEPIAA